MTPDEDTESAANCIPCDVCESKHSSELPIRKLIVEHVELYRSKAAEQGAG